MITRFSLPHRWTGCLVSLLLLPFYTAFSQAPSKGEMEADSVKFSGLTAEQAAREITAPPGFSTTLFAGEPDVSQPIAFCLDDRGRLWVAEGLTYPVRAPEGKGRDRILLLEDTNGDGRHDKRTIFMDKLNLVSGMEIGFGGVWVGAAPHLMFIPVTDWTNPKPAGEPKIVMDGFDYKSDTHETLNTFNWGPDGWLYGCHGVFTDSRVGKPGTPDSERTRLNAGVWRFHPQKLKFEVFAEGTSNPWGIDFDQNGQCFIEACVIPHLWHMIQGGRFQRQAGQHFNPHIYDDIKQIGDHVHYAGNKGPHAANGRSDAEGGGHAHAGLMVYLGGSWPEQYQGKLFMNNIHGQRINQDEPVRKGSGFVGKHNPDFLFFNDRWSQVLNLMYDHDGSVYMIDWYDKNQCHHNNEAGHDRSNGRIFKVAYNQQKVSKVDLQTASDIELVSNLKHKNEWYARHSKRILQERGANPAVTKLLEQQFRSSIEPVHRLRSLWTLHLVGGLSPDLVQLALKDSNEYVRAWVIQLLLEDGKPSETTLKSMSILAASDPSPVVRLYLASGLQRIPVNQRREILFSLTSHSEDVGDHNLPYLYWYAAEGLVGSDLAFGSSLLQQTKIPRMREWIARRMTSVADSPGPGSEADQVAASSGAAR